MLNEGGILMDDQYKHSLTTDGFASLKSVFIQSDVDQLEYELDQFFPMNAKHEPARAKRLSGQTLLEINRTLRHSRYFRTCCVFRQCQQLASDFLGREARYTFDHAIYKYPGSDSTIGWHQDQAYQFRDLCMRSLHFWIPLQDSAQNNGSLEFVFGSHKLPLLEHRKIPGSNLLELTQSEIVESVGLTIPRGGLSIHLPNTIHRSVENTSNTIRKAWILHFSPLGKWDILRPKNLATQLSRIAS